MFCAWLCVGRKGRVDKELQGHRGGRTYLCLGRGVRRAFQKKRHLGKARKAEKAFRHWEQHGERPVGLEGHGMS